jgi:hypothetical protein
MKCELIKTEDYLLVVSDDIPNEGDKCLANGKTYDNEIVTYAKCPIPPPFVSNLLILKKIIAHLPLNGSPYLDGVDVLPPLDESVEDMMRSIVSNDNTSKEGFITGWHLCKQTYKYTEEDVKRAISFGQGMELWKEEEQIDKFIQSINQPKLPIAFECAMEQIDCPDNKPGCLVAHLGQAKITNSEGRTEWVGKYLFN